MNIRVATSTKQARRIHARDWLTVAYQAYIDWQTDGDVESFLDWIRDEKKELERDVGARGDGPPR
jgi:hypothetical protein